VSRLNVVTLLAELESRGLIVRRPSADDRRSYLVSLLARLVALLRTFRTVDSNPKLR
jgi:DNA-binding MarR family transcriptional regulator